MKKSLRFLVGLAILPLLAPVSVHAQSTVYACVNSNSGTIKIVSATATCNTGDMKVSWDIVGPPGPQGPAGPQGPQGPAGAQGPAGPTNVFGLTVTLAGTGTGMVTSSDTGIVCGADCTEVYPTGTSVTLSPTPSTGSTFIGWSGDCSGTGPCTLTLSATRTVTAQFDGPCSGEPVVVHSNGVGQKYFDCRALGTYDLTSAKEAADAWAKASGHPLTIAIAEEQCGQDNVVVAFDPSPSQLAIWVYSGPNIGHVKLTSGLCPGPSDPTWN